MCKAQSSSLQVSNFPVIYCFLWVYEKAHLLPEKSVCPSSTVHFSGALFRRVKYRQFHASSDVWEWGPNWFLVNGPKRPLGGDSCSIKNNVEPCFLFAKKLIFYRQLKFPPRVKTFTNVKGQLLWREKMAGKFRVLSPDSIFSTPCENTNGKSADIVRCCVRCVYNNTQLSRKCSVFQFLTLLCSTNVFVCRK